MLLVDDHSLVRYGLRLLINNEFPDAFIDEAENEDECLAKIKLFPFDLVLLDLNMPDSDPFNIVQFINQNCPQTKTLIITMSSEESYAYRFFQEGVMGFINKSSPNERLLSAIKLVMSGRKYISENLTRILAEKQIKKEINNPFDLLTKREFQIALGLIGGKTIQEISLSLSISSSTVSTYKGKIYEKLSIANHNLSQLIQLAKDNNVT